MADRSSNSFIFGKDKKASTTGIWNGFGTTHTPQSCTLFVTNIPPDTDIAQVEGVFKLDVGFFDFRVMKGGKRRCVFVDYESIADATSAMISHQNHCFPGVDASNGLCIDYDKDPKSKRSRAREKYNKTHEPMQADPSLAPIKITRTVVLHDATPEEQKRSLSSLGGLGGMGGGGMGGGGGPGRGRIVCYHCGQVGHGIRNCEQAKRQGGRGRGGASREQREENQFNAMRLQRQQIKAQQMDPKVRLHSEPAWGELKEAKDAPKRPLAPGGGDPVVVVKRRRKQSGEGGGAKPEERPEPEKAKASGEASSPPSAGLLGRSLVGYASGSDSE